MRDSTSGPKLHGNAHIRPAAVANDASSPFLPNLPETLKERRFHINNTDTVQRYRTRGAPYLQYIFRVPRGSMTCICDKSLKHFSLWSAFKNPATSHSRLVPKQQHDTLPTRAPSLLTERKGGKDDSSFRSDIKCR